MATTATGKSGRFIVPLILGAALPAVTVLIEQTTRMCAGALFDPLPTLGHLLVASFVPLANALVWLELKGRSPLPSRWCGALIGFALATSAVYSLFFLPFVPFAIFGILFFGLGLLPLTPLLAFLAALWQRRMLVRAAQARGARRPVVWMGALAALLVLITLDLPRTLTRAGLQLAVSPDAASSARGLAWLRVFGSEDELIRYCYPQRGRAADLLGLVWWGLKPITMEQARVVFFRVTGQAFSSLPEPRRPRGGFPFLFDGERGGAVVGARQEGVSLIGSRLDGSLDADAALSYTEWTLEFRNDSPVQQEARAQIAVPSGGVVSRVTLWIDGEEREAAFGGRGAVRRAYQAVVRQRRDPLLVTSAGPGRVLVQCFPIAPSGGRMKIRLGITAPLELRQVGQGLLTLPHFTEWNFERDSVEHSVWYEGRRPMGARGLSLSSERTADGAYALRGRVAEGNAAEVAILIERDAATRRAWARDARAKDGAAVWQSIEPDGSSPPDRVLLVVDASSSIAPLAGEIAASLAHLPAQVPLRMVLATDQPQMDGDPQDVLRRASWRGGADNLPGLALAWDQAARGSNAVIVWIHGPQPVLAGSAADLRQRFDRRSGSPRLIAVAAARGPNRILEQLEGVAEVTALTRVSSLSADLEELFQSWARRGQRIRIVRERKTARPSAMEGRRTSDHLVRLWAADEIERLARTSATREEAVRLAVHHRLVTSVSGAVVLETAQQYSQAGLDPAPPQEVPTVPEPETWALLALASLLLCVMWRRRPGRSPCAARRCS